MRSTVSSSIVRGPGKRRNCLGDCFVLSGQSRVPLPPARIDAYIVRDTLVLLCRKTDWLHKPRFSIRRSEHAKVVEEAPRLHSMGRRLPMASWSRLRVANLTLSK